MLLHERVKEAFTGTNFVVLEIVGLQGSGKTKLLYTLLSKLKSWDIKFYNDIFKVPQTVYRNSVQVFEDFYLLDGGIRDSSIIHASRDMFFDSSSQKKYSAKLLRILVTARIFQTDDFAPNLIAYTSYQCSASPTIREFIRLRRHSIMRKSKSIPYLVAPKPYEIGTFRPRRIPTTGYGGWN